VLIEKEIVELVNGLDRQEILHHFYDLVIRDNDKIVYHSDEYSGSDLA